MRCKFNSKAIRSLAAVLLPLIALALTSGGGGIALAQSDTSQVSGFVTDATGGVVPGAMVTVTNEATGVVRTAETNATGYWIVTSIQGGLYTVAVEAEGFKRFVSTQNKVDANLPASVDAMIEIGDVTEVVEVVADVASLQTQTATVGRVVENQQIQNLMLNGRNPVLLALLKPGVRRGSSMASFTFAMTSGGYSMNGSRSQDNVITNDGAVATRTRANGTGIGAPDLDTVQEIQILTANFNAEYGRSGGGQIRIVTRSGQQDFRGSIYEYFRNNELDANSWNRNRQGNPREALKFNQFGYNFSGPIYSPNGFNKDRNKLFFLWSQEWVRFRREQTTQITVPSLDMRAGNFSELLGPSHFFNDAQIVNDPDTGTPFANNTIPMSRLSRNGIGFMNAAPAPNGRIQGTTDNFVQTRPRPTNQRKDTLNIDVHPGQNHTIRARWLEYHFTQTDAFRGGTDRTATDWDRPNRTLTLNHIWTASPTVVNEALFSYSIDEVYIGVVQEGERFLRGQYGIDYQYLFNDPKEIQEKIPTIEIPGSPFQRVDGGPYPAASTGPIWQAENTTTNIRGNHTFKFGVRFAYQGQDDFDQINVTGVPGGTNNQNGRFVFSDARPGGTGVGIGNAALGLFTTYAEIGTRSLTLYRSRDFEWFAQDSWNVTDRLKLELGVRHTILTPYYYAKWGNMSIFDPSRYDPSRAVVQDPQTGNVLSGDRYNGVLIPGSGWPSSATGEHPLRPGKVNVSVAQTGEFDHLFSGEKYFPQTQYNNFQPRVGLAYSFNDKTVLRAGGGRFYARPGVADNIFLGGNPPFQPMASLSNGLADNPGGASRVAFPQFFMTLDPVFKIPSAWNWNVSMQRDIGFSTTFEVSYVGRTGLHLERTREINALAPGTLQNPANAGLNVNYLRPYKGFAFINLGENAARSQYHGLQFDVNRRFSNGLGFGFAYTLSESFDNASHRRRQTWNPFNDADYWGPSEFDTRHVAVINFLWEIPFLKDKSTMAGKLLGGWQLSGVTQFQTGTPFTVGTGDDFAGIGSGGQFQPWAVSGDATLSRSERAFSNAGGDSNFALRTTDSSGGPLFTEPNPGTFSTQGRSQYYHPGFQNWNVAVFKRFTMTERQNILLRAELYNFVNHPNWSGINTNPRSGTFGKVTSKRDQRNIQLSLRYTF